MALPTRLNSKINIFEQSPPFMAPSRRHFFAYRDDVQGEGETGNRSRDWPVPCTSGRSHTSMCSTTLGLPVHRRGRQEKVRPGTGREAGLGHAGSGRRYGRSRTSMCSAALELPRQLLHALLYLLHPCSRVHRAAAPRLQGCQVGARMSAAGLCAVSSGYGSCAGWVKT
jgi:hypothetical protein